MVHHITVIVGVFIASLSSYRRRILLIPLCYIWNIHWFSLLLSVDLESLLKAGACIAYSRFWNTVLDPIAGCAPVRQLRKPACRTADDEGEPVLPPLSHLLLAQSWTGFLQIWRPRRDLSGALWQKFPLPEEAAKMDDPNWSSVMI